MGRADALALTPCAALIAIALSPDFVEIPIFHRLFFLPVNPLSACALTLH